jgi:anti-sigma factor RsiW
MVKQAEQYPGPAQLSDLSALADGSLDPSRRQTVEQWIAGSPHLRILYERERAAVEMLHSAATERAPARLRMYVGSQRASRATRERWKPGYGALAAALAAAALALALLLPGGTPGSPSVSQAARLALRGPSGPAPAVDPGDPGTKLAQRIQGLYFPNWSPTLGWQPVGVRSDRLGGRPAVTVYYRRGAMSVAYTIIGTPALARPSVPLTHLGGFALQRLSLRGRTVVTWRRAGRTCVISASGVSTRVLEQLADWPAARITH